MMVLRKHIFKVALLAVIITTTALAGGPDLPRSEDWNGFYVSGELGGGWTQTRWCYTNANFFNTLGPTVVGNVYDINSGAIVGGGNLGYNYQSGHWVFGLVGSVLGADFGNTIASPFFPAIDTYAFSLRLISMLEGQIGYAFGQWLFYVSGGWAGGHVRLTLTDVSSNVRASSTRWFNGWTVNTGVAYKLTSYLFLGLTFNYINLGIRNNTVSCPACGSGVGFGTPIVNGTVQTYMGMASISYLIGAKSL